MQTIKKVSVKELNKKIEKNNSLFESLSKAEQRVFIAKDVLHQIAIKKYVPMTGRYINTDTVGLSYGDDIKKNFSKIKNCNCCALGSCLLSITKQKNTLRTEDLHGFIYGTEEIKQLLTSVFTPKQLLLIEVAFEGDNGDGYSVFAQEHLGLDYNDFIAERKKCNENFYNKKYDAKERLIAIMKNLIANKGTFKP